MPGHGRLHVIVFLSFLVIGYGIPQAARVHINKRSAKSRALTFSKACHFQTACKNVTCNNPDGWNILGSDWGCCGNYEGCCILASVICLAHDVFCKCCEYGLWCGPTCKPDLHCENDISEPEYQRFNGSVTDVDEVGSGDGSGDLRNEYMPVPFTKDILENKRSRKNENSVISETMLYGDSASRLPNDKSMKDNDLVPKQKNKIHGGPSKYSHDEGIEGSGDTDELTQVKENKYWGWFWKR